MHRQLIKYLNDICELPPLPIWVKIEVQLFVSMGELVDTNLLHLSTTFALIAESLWKPMAIIIGWMMQALKN
jgi:hypothetical protein